eukprot:gnl/TRDRNA2_/TRDRNA2_185789_c0_seq1.p1 gnl/TRDRNA2_/TRDRNA2_185789_c0~~gnl/TRDRNA2_/TRDRNA2_185789_c0_seq1.p1  ORF type:complete len:525 (+),score=82.52 gnl/TRDRNA2_/TRDRNA2_185789_c0_seq1:97-1671(+)
MARAAGGQLAAQAAVFREELADVQSALADLFQGRAANSKAASVPPSTSKETVADDSTCCRLAGAEPAKPWLLATDGRSRSYNPHSPPARSPHFQERAALVEALATANDSQPKSSLRSWSQSAESTAPLRSRSAAPSHGKPAAAPGAAERLAMHEFAMVAATSEARAARWRLVAARYAGELAALESECADQWSLRCGARGAAPSCPGAAFLMRAAMHRWASLAASGQDGDACEGSRVEVALPRNSGSSTWRRRTSTTFSRRMRRSALRTALCVWRSAALRSLLQVGIDTCTREVSARKQMVCRQVVKGAIDKERAFAAAALITWRQHAASEGRLLLANSLHSWAQSASLQHARRHRDGLRRLLVDKMLRARRACLLRAAELWRLAATTKQLSRCRRWVAGAPRGCAMSAALQLRLVAATLSGWQRLLGGHRIRRRSRSALGPFWRLAVSLLVRMAAHKDALAAHTCLAAWRRVTATQTIRRSSQLASEQAAAARPLAKTEEDAGWAKRLEEQWQALERRARLGGM